MNTYKIIKKYYKPGSKQYEILVNHSQAVAGKALIFARNYKVRKLDTKFIKEAAMLHDIGIYLTDAPECECFGREPYIKHGILGRNILDNEGLNKHGLVCERHIGVGLSKEEIKRNNFPLPKRDMLPRTEEEEIICLADLFFTKIEKNLFREKSLGSIRKKYAKYGKEDSKRLEKLINKYLK
jgi:uncharacterized protein